MADPTSMSPVTYRNHWPTPIASNNVTVAGAPASFEPPARRNRLARAICTTQSPMSPARLRRTGNLWLPACDGDMSTSLQEGTFKEAGIGRPPAWSFCLGSRSPAVGSLQRDGKPKTPEDLGTEGDDLGDHPLFDPEDVDGQRAVGRIALAQNVAGHGGLPVGACGHAAQPAELLGAESRADHEAEDRLATHCDLGLGRHPHD